MGTILILLGLISLGAGLYGAYVVSQVSFSGLFDGAAMFGEMMGLFGTVDPRVEFVFKLAQARRPLVIVGAVLLVVGLMINSSKKKKNEQMPVDDKKKEDELKSTDDQN